MTFAKKLPLSSSTLILLSYLSKTFQVYSAHILSEIMISKAAVYESGNEMILETTDKDGNSHLFPLKFQQVSY